MKKVGFQGVHGDDPDGLSPDGNRDCGIRAEAHGLSPGIDLNILLFCNVCENNGILVLHDPSGDALAKGVALSGCIREVFDPALMDNLKPIGFRVQLVDVEQSWSDQSENTAG